MVGGEVLSCRVECLVPGTVVQFYVIATNIVGDSKPSETSPLYYVVGHPLWGIQSSKLCY